MENPNTFSFPAEVVVHGESLDVRGVVQQAVSLGLYQPGVVLTRGTPGTVDLGPDAGTPTSAPRNLPPRASTWTPPSTTGIKCA